MCVCVCVCVIQIEARGAEKCRRVEDKVKIDNSRIVVSEKSREPGACHVIQLITYPTCKRSNILFIYIS